MATQKKGSRISGSPAVFNPYINTTDDHLLAIEPTSGLPYWQWLGLTNPNATDWHNKRLFWSTPVTGLFARYSNPETSTSIVKAQVKQFIKDFQTFANPLLEIIAASPNGSVLEEGIFNLVLKKNRHKPTHPHTKIAEQCFTNWTGEGAANKKAASHTDSEAKGRASVAEGADGVQYAYVITDTKPTAARSAVPLSAAPPPPADQPFPQHPDDGTKQEFFSGATHQFNFGAANADKYLLVWSRWFNSKHPELAGDWNEMQTVRI